MIGRGRRSDGGKVAAAATASAFGDVWLLLMDCGEVRIWGEWNAMDGWSWEARRGRVALQCTAVGLLLSCLGPAVCWGIDVGVGLSTT